MVRVFFVDILRRDKTPGRYLKRGLTLSKYVERGPFFDRDCPSLI